MTNIQERAKAYEPKKIPTIAELPSVDTSAEIFEENAAEFPYAYIVVNGTNYKVPNSVLADLKEQLAENPALKSFKVRKSGDGLNTRYAVIPLLA